MPIRSRAVLVRAFILPDAPFAITSRHVAEKTLEGVGRWRHDFLRWLESGPDELSFELSALLTELCGDEVGRSLSNYASYQLTAFPVSSSDPLSDLRHVLLWRAAIVDFLSDVWDTLGAADFELAECNVAIGLLTPDDANTPGRCNLCLQPMAGPPSRHHLHFDQCPVQLAWRRSLQ